MILKMRRVRKKKKKKKKMRRIRRLRMRIRSLFPLPLLKRQMVVPKEHEWKLRNKGNKGKLLVRRKPQRWKKVRSWRIIIFLILMMTPVMRRYKCMLSTSPF